MVDFIGSKAALFYQGKLVVMRRDNKPGLPFADMWDFPGGASEPGETPVQCLVREVQEELGIGLDPTVLVWQKTYPAMADPSRTAYFMAATLTPEQFAAIRLGDEGQEWQLMTIEAFMANPAAIGFLKQRLQDYLRDGAGASGSTSPGTSV